MTDASGPRRVKPAKQSKFETRPNTGSLFFVGQKESEKHPDYTGRINVGGRLFAIAAWVRTSESGKEYLSIAVDKEYL